MFSSRTFIVSITGEKLLKIPTYGGWTTRCWIIQQHFWWDSKADLSPVEHRRPHWGTMSQWRLEISLICSWPGGCADNEYLNIGSSLERDEQGIFRGCHRGYKESKATHLSFLHLFETIYNFFYICFSYNEVRKEICKEMCKQVCQRCQTMGIKAEGFCLFVCFLKCSAVQMQQIILRGVEGAWINKAPELLWQK